MAMHTRIEKTSNLSFVIARDDVPTFGEMPHRCRKERCGKTSICLMANDDLALVRFGPRGGTKVIKVLERAIGAS